jgi:hypothetical protein
MEVKFIQKTSEITLPNGKTIGGYKYDDELTLYNIGDIYKAIGKNRNVSDMKGEDILKVQMMRDTIRGKRIPWFTDKYGLVEIVMKTRGGDNTRELKKYIIDNINSI